MDFLFDGHQWYVLLLLAVCSLAGGFIDAVVGGGGLITLPAVLVNLPNYSLPTLFGTNKIASLSGTSIAAFQYSKKVKFNAWLLAITAISAAFASYLGATLLVHINSKTLKPAILVVLVIIAIYTFAKKDLGAIVTKAVSEKKEKLYGFFIGGIIGFYDGFFGPGTGSFLVLAFVLILGFDFLKASAYSKVVNCITNIAALTVFIKHKNYLIGIAMLMAICNIAGSFIGAKYALKKGNKFIRKMFLVVVCIMIVRYAYDVFYK